MPRKISVGAVAAIILLSCLCGCSKKDGNADKLGKLKEKMEQQTTANKSNESSSKKDIQKKQQQEQTEDDKAPDGFFAKAFYENEVENNGSMFVRAGNRVYYRVYSPNALSRSVIGWPSPDEVNSNAPSTLMYYDLDREENVEVCEISGIGNLYATVDGICIASYPEGYHSTTVVDENGEVNEHFLDGNITAASADGRSVVIGETDEDERIIPCLYRDGVRIGVPEKDGEQAGFGSLGFVQNSLIVKKSSATGAGTVFSYDETGELTELGDLKTLDMGGYELYPTVEDVTGVDKGYITIGYRDGTANALAGWRIYSFIPGTPDSLEIYDEGQPDTEYDFEPPKVIAGNGKEPRLSPHRAGEVYLSEGMYGDLVYTAASGEDIVIRKDMVSEPDSDLKYVTNLDSGYCFDDKAAFYLEINGQRSPDDDIGWRMAFELNNINYRLMLFDADHINEAGFPTGSILADVSSSGWSDGQIEYDRLIGDWKAYSYNVEGEYRPAEAENGVNDEMIRFDENGDALIYHKDRATGKISNEKPMHQAGPDEYFESDFAYIYNSEDEDPLRAGICYLSHNDLKIYYLYHFDGGSTGWYEITYHRVDQ